MNSKLKSTHQQLQQSHSKEEQATMLYKKTLIENIKLQQTCSEMKDSVLKYTRDCKNEIQGVKVFNQVSHQQICRHINDLYKKIELITQLD